MRGIADAAQRRVGLDHDLERQPGGLRLDRLEQPLVGEDRRMDRVRELAQGGEQVAEVPLELGQRLVGPRVAAAQPFPRQRQLGRQRHDVLLGAVVQVPLDALPLGVLGVPRSR